MPAIGPDTRILTTENGHICAFSFIRTMTVGPGISPDLLTLSTEALAGSQLFTLHTAGGEFHPALRTQSDMTEFSEISRKSFVDFHRVTVWSSRILPQVKISKLRYSGM